MIPTHTDISADSLADSVSALLAQGARFGGLFASRSVKGPTLLTAVVAERKGLTLLEATVAASTASYPALTAQIPAAAWYEREIHDLFGLEPAGHGRLDPLVLPLRSGTPRETALAVDAPVEIEESALGAHVHGEGMFTIPYGPVRSGVFESIEYLLETPGEDIPHIRSRIYYKHRGIERRFERLPVDQAVLVAERVEGIASVAHAIAFSRAIEALAGVEVPERAELLRVVHAELERVANHLDSMIRHTEGSGQAVAYARLSLHKERALRLQATLCGHRFARGVVLPGGVIGPPLAPPKEILEHIGALEHALDDDIQALMATPSFTDRLRGTGAIPAHIAQGHGALGPVGRASGMAEDVRIDRPYGAYAHLGFQIAEPHSEGDALARQRIRIDEIRSSFHLIRQALDLLATTDDRGPMDGWHTEIGLCSGKVISSVEAPQGELLYMVESDGNRLLRVKPRCASFHNLALFPQAFQGDIFTDFVFIEASFGMCIAGAAG
ncbi:MAG: NADH-quinone oxidoreductase subunit C [Actinobacteria bacterium]|nr:NADH-quinone oxidoreductase subunit C [Actinomycetota bacterium]